MAITIAGNRPCNSAWQPLLIAFMPAIAIAVVASLRHTSMAMRLAPSIMLMKRLQERNDIEIKQACKPL